MMEPNELLTKMVEIYSPSGSESEHAKFLKKSLEGMGISCKIDEVGNVVAKVSGNKKGPTILLCGHIDVVPPKLEVKVEDTKLYGRGSVDAKSPFASMICAVKNMMNNEFNGKIILAGVVEEETQSKGVKNLIKNGIKFDYGIIGEPSNTENLTIGYRGSMFLSLEVKTTPGHFGNPNTINAIDFHVQIVNKINEYVKLEKKKSLKQSLTFRSVSIKSNDPFTCLGEFNVRVPYRLNCKDVSNELQSIIEEVSKEKEGIDVKLQILDKAEPYITDKKSELIQAFQEAVKQEIGEYPRLILKTGTADINYLGSVYSKPMVAYGPGDSRMDHGPIEFVDFKDYQKAIRILTNVLKILLK
ncbi:MAG: M20/M25/M40 family metallo-hydrolase [Candidatus Ranarchaeia archaeon]